MDGVTLPENTYIPSTERVGPDSDQKLFEGALSLQFSEEVASTNVKLVVKVISYAMNSEAGLLSAKLT